MPAKFGPESDILSTDRGTRYQNVTRSRRDGAVFSEGRGMKIENIDEALEAARALKAWSYQEKYKEHSEGTVLGLEVIRTAGSLCEQVLETIQHALREDFERHSWSVFMRNILEYSGQCVAAVNKLAYRMYLRRGGE